MTAEECAEIRAEINRSFVVEEEITTPISDINGGNLSTLTTTSSDAVTFNMHFRWRDDNNDLHPLRNVRIEIHEREVIGSTILGITHTDDNGYFTYIFSNSDGSWDEGKNIFIKVFAGDANAKVKMALGLIDYFYDSSTYTDVYSGDMISRSFTFSMENDFGKALQISQAILTARDYAQIMMGRLPDNVVVIYPNGDNCHYNSILTQISITGNVRNSNLSPHSYASWDVIMHEYGHHVEYQMNIIDSPGGNHTFEEDLCVTHTKEEGIKLAWSEAWATVFGMIAQDYYVDILEDIDTVNNGKYESYNRRNPYLVENNGDDFLGEGCEGAVLAVLWDLYDSANDGYDTLTMGHNAFWSLSTSNQPKTFSDFVNDFNYRFPGSTYELGKNLEHYGISTTNIVVSNDPSVSPTVPPVITWLTQRASVAYPNNRFVLIFFDENGGEIFRTSTISGTSYTLTQAQWDLILARRGFTYSVAISATQTSSPTTGAYVSPLTVLSKNLAPGISESVLIAGGNKYTEKVATLYPAQYIDYTITFMTGGNKIFQTFGSQDTKICLYNKDYEVLAQNDDSGYNNNAFLNYEVTAYTTYILRVNFYSDSASGDIKTTITSYSSDCTDFDNLENYTNNSALYYSKNFPSYPQPVKVITFTPTKNGTYTISTNYTGSSDTDTYIYIVDPSVTSACYYDDNSGGNSQASITATLVGGRKYYIVLSQYNLSAEGDKLVITFTKI